MEEHALTYAVNQNITVHAQVVTKASTVKEKVRSQYVDFECKRIEFQNRWYHCNQAPFSFSDSLQTFILLCFF